MKKIIISLLLSGVCFAETYTITLPEQVKIEQCTYQDKFNGYVFGTEIQCKGELNGAPYIYQDVIYPTKAPVKIEFTDGLTFDICENKK